MTIDKNITVDLNRVQPLKTIQIHEGDTNSVRLVFTLTKDSADVDLSSVSIRYDAVIGDYLAEQDAPGSIEDGKAVVPVTANMTARSGILKVDVKLVEGDSVLFTQTIKLLVERSVINGDTIIDISGTTIDQKLDQLTLQFEGFENNYYTKAEVDAELEKRYTKSSRRSRRGSGHLHRCADALPHLLRGHISVPDLHLRHRRSVPLYKIR